MSADNLLLWLSARTEGSWPQFRGAVEELHVQLPENADDRDELDRASSGRPLPLYQQLRFALERLAHVEFVSDADLRWRIVPPALALLTEGGDASGIVCGARGPRILDELAKLSDVRVDVCEAAGMPDRILLTAGSQLELSAAVGRLGYHVQPSASKTLLAALAPIGERKGWTISEFPGTPGWTIHRFSSSQLRWTEVGTDAKSATMGTGLFRFVMKHQRFHYVLCKGLCFRVPVQVGKYAVIRRRRDVVHYDARARVVSVLPICRPPLLIERALILCSGLLPQFDESGRLAYRDVPHDVARQVARLLCQELG